MTKIITANSRDYNWEDKDGVFTWPTGVEIHLTDTEEVYKHDEARTMDGILLCSNPGQTGACGSPCHQILVENNLV